MSDTNVKLVAQIDATSKGLVNALNQAAGAVTQTTSKMQQKFDGLNGAVNQIGEHVEKLNELISRAGEGALDVNAIQAELKALEQAQSQVVQASSAFDGLANAAQTASKKIETSAQATSNATGAFDAMTKKINIGGIALKDLKDAFSDSANSAAAWGNIYAAAIQMVVSGVQNAIKNVQELRASMEQVENLMKSSENVDVFAHIEDTGKIASKMKELYTLRENWTGSEEDKAREKLLQNDIAWLQQFQKESDRITVAIDGQTVAQEKLRDAIAETLEMEQKLKKEALRKSIDDDTEKLKEAKKKLDEIKDLPDDFASNMKRQLGLLFSGEFSKFIDSGTIGPNALSGFNLRQDQVERLKDFWTIYERLQKQGREYVKLGHESAADHFIYEATAQAKDKAQAKTQAQASAEQAVKTSISDLNLGDAQRTHEQAVRAIEDEYKKNIGAGVSENTAKELKQLQLKQLAEKEATALQDEENKRQQELIAQIEKRKQAYEQAEKQYLQAEKEVEKAQKNLADVEKNLAREKQAEAIRTRRSEIKNQLSAFGFSIAEGFDPYESVSNRNYRVRTQKTDASISAKMAEWQAGRKVHFTPAEKRRLEEYEGLKNEDKALEASQLQMDAAKKQENAALSLASAAEVLKNASIRLNETKSTKEAAFSVLDTNNAIPTTRAKIEDITPTTAVAKKVEGETLKGLTANGVTGTMGVSYSDQLSKIQATLQELASKTFRVI